MSGNSAKIMTSSSYRGKGWPWERTEVSATLDLENDWPSITIIMPSYNQGRFIEESIRSVLFQNYPNLEFMIFDGGSNDNTLKIIKKYEKLIAFWESKEDRGQSHAINKGFSKATGEYVAWLNSDDLYYPGALMEIAKAIRANPTAGMIYGSGSKIDINSQVILEIPCRPYSKKLLATRFYILQQSSFIKRSILEKEDMVMESLHYTMDWELSIRVSRRAPVVAINSKIGMFRIYNECKTQAGKWVRRKEIAKVGRICNGIFDRNYLIFLLFYPLFKYDICMPGIKGVARCTLCHWWRRTLALFVDPDTHMMH